MFQFVLEGAYAGNEAPEWIFLKPNQSFYNIDLLQEVTSEHPPIHSENLSDWGPKRDPLYIVIPITVVYVVIFFAGVVGNVSTCIVIARNKSMHTATNYYLFSLAISDLLLLISGLPPEIYSIWSKYPYIFGEAFCILQGFAAETSANATVLTITAFTIERYVAICHPFLSHTMSKLSRAIKFVIGVWIVAMCLAVPQAMSLGIVYERLPDGRMANDEHYVCNVKNNLIPFSFEFSTVLFFVAPMSVITILYILIGLQLHRSTVGPSRSNSVKLKHRVYKPVVAYTSTSTQAVLVVNGDNSECSQLARQEEDGRKNFSSNSQATRHVVKMLVAVVVAFFICWAPFHAQRLLAIYGENTTTNMITAFRVLTYTSGILYYLSTSINPLLYHIMSHRFREAFKDTFNRFFRRGKRLPGRRCYSTLSARSSQLNSHSNTDSCSRQSSLRYLDAEMIRVHNSRRPLVVSFRRKKTQYPKRSKQVAFDEELQQALDNIKEPLRQNVYNIRSSSLCIPNGDTSYDVPVYNNVSPRNDPYVELHNLEPKHICPLNNTKLPHVIESTPKLNDIEIFQEEHFKLNRIRRDHLKVENRSHHRRRLEADSGLTKSTTMPQIVYSQPCVLGSNVNYNLHGHSNVLPGGWQNNNIRVSDDDCERSSSCSHLELIRENTENHLTCRPSEGIIIQVT